MLDVGQGSGYREYCNEKYNAEIQLEKIAYSSNSKEIFN
jgi:hypothetical protein